MGLLWRGKHTFKGNVHFGGGVSGAISPSMGSGKVFYVNGESYGPSASDNWSGEDPNYPKATITSAIASCRQRTQDYIFVQGFYQTDTFPIVINKRNIHIIGVGAGTPFTNRALVDGVGESAFETGGSGGGTELAGLRMGASTGEDPCITIGADTWFMWIHDCSFGKYIGATTGILGEGAVHMMGWCIEHNWFGDALTEYGIHSLNNDENYIRDNVFDSISERGIYLAGSSSGEILENWFFAPIAGAESIGWAITMYGVSNAGTIIMGNHASQHGGSSADGGNNPYLDESGATLILLKNGWSGNWDGQNPNAYPAITT